MNLDDQVDLLLSNKDLSSIRLGVLNVTSTRTAAAVAEKIDLDLLVGEGQACELILVDALENPLGLQTVARRLSRDGLLIASVSQSSCDKGVIAVAGSGVDWVAVLPIGEDRILIASRDIHPDEFSPTLGGHVVGTVNPACLNLPQNRADRARRRHVRRHGRESLLALAEKLRREYGEAVRRVIHGIEILVAERSPLPETRGRRPGMFSIPDLNAVAWPLCSERPNLDRVTEICRIYGESVAEELQGLIVSGSFAAYLTDSYNRTKFMMDDPDCWQSIRLINWRESASNLPAIYPATRAMLTELGALVSGEVNILRLPPGKSLPPHHDDYDCEEYIHIGINVPNNCAIRVGGEERRWQRGQPIIFSPAYLHEVWNNSDQPRDVVAIDTWHSDLSAVEVAAIVEVRNELEALRLKRHRDSA